MRRLLCLLCLTALASAEAAATDNTVFASSFETTWVSGYHVGYQRDLYPTAAIHFAGLTHIMVGRVTPNGDGTLTKTFDIDVAEVEGPAWAQGVASAAHAYAVKAVLMVGGAGEYGWHDATTVHADTPGGPQVAHLPIFVDSLLATMDQLGFDGLDLDWEPLEEADHGNFLALAQALRAARPGIILTVPIGWANANFPDPIEPFYAQIAPLFDQINIMSYDMAGEWDGWYSWHSSALTGWSGHTPSSVDSSVDFYLRSGVPRSRLGIGLPFYGTCWTGVSGPGQQGGHFVASDNTMSYHDIVTRYYSAANAKWDATAQVPYLGANANFGSNPSCRFVSYDDASSIATKGAYVHRQGLGGTIIWTIGQGYLPEKPAGQRDPLLEAVKAAFLQ